MLDKNKRDLILALTKERGEHEDLLRVLYIGRDVDAKRGVAFSLEDVLQNTLARIREIDKQTAEAESEVSHA